MAKKQQKFLGISKKVWLWGSAGFLAYLIFKPKATAQSGGTTTPSTSPTRTTTADTGLSVTPSVNGIYIGSTRDIYFKTQASALEYVFDDVEKKYDIIFPENIWTEHVPYGKVVRYNLGLMTKNGNLARKSLTIVLYRMDSGNYELIYYYN